MEYFLKQNKTKNSQIKERDEIEFLSWGGWRAADGKGGGGLDDKWGDSLTRCRLQMAPQPASRFLIHYLSITLSL